MSNSVADASAALQRGQELEARGSPDDLVEAIRAYDESIARWEQLVQTKAENAAANLGIVWMNRGNALQRQGTATSLGEACQAYDRAIVCFNEAEPEKNLLIRNSLGAAWMNRGLTLHRFGAPEALAEAEYSHRAAISLLTTLPLEENNWYRLNLAAAWMNLANVLLGFQPAGRFAEARVAARESVALLQAFEKSDLVTADLVLKARRAWCDALGQLLVNPPPDLTREALAAEASDAVDDGLAVIRHWQALDPTLSSELAIRFYRFGAQLYRFHQPQFLAEFLLENLGTSPPAQAAEFRRIALEAVDATMVELRPRHFLSVDNPAHARLAEIWRSLQDARAELEKFQPASP